MRLPIDIEALDEIQLEHLRDAISQRLLQMRRTRGLTLPELLRLFEETKTVLSEQHKEWRSLESWQWMDGEIRFWLNPTDQDLYRAGWFSIDDLIAWAQNRGPVVIEPEFDEEDEGEDVASDSWRGPDGVTIRWLPESASREEEPRLSLS